LQEVVSYYHLSNVQPINLALMENGCWLLLLNAKHIPPHIVISIEGMVYGNSVRGTWINKPLKKILEYAQRKAQGLVGIELKLKPSGIQLQAFESELLKLKPVTSSSATCLHPIKLFLAQFIPYDPEKVNFVFQLINELENRDSILKVFHLGMEDHFVHESSPFSMRMPSYGWNVIDYEIKASKLLYANASKR